MYFIILILQDDDIHKIHARDPEIFEKIYREYSSRVFNFLVIKVNGNKEIAEELFCETFHSALEKAPQLKKAKSMLPWIMRIAKNKFYDHLRRKYREKKHTTPDENIADERLNHDDQIEEKDKVIMLDLAMKNLKEKYREVLTLKYIEKKSQKEIETILGQPETTVTSLLFRARKSLKVELKKLAL